MKPYRSLYELNMLVRDAVEMSLDEPYWVEAELQDVRQSNGHCYMELVQKDVDGATPIARAAAVCWRNTWQPLRMHFERITNQPFCSGLKVLLQVVASFHEAYGFKWVVTDVNPTYTLGDMVLRRQQIIDKLKASGIYDLQRQLQLPQCCQRIAIVSSKTAAGYGDFCRQLNENAYHLKFTTTLFEATMQGEQVEQTIVEALNQIYNRMENYDCVVVIRGGGATSDMSGFDTFRLAENVANFPLPIITGIGHDRDESILDLVAHASGKTPTAVAAMLIDHQHAQLQLIGQLKQRLGKAAIQHTELARTRIQTLMMRLRATIMQRLNSEQHRLQLLQYRLKGADPQQMLKRGYSFTMSKGRIITSTDQLKEGDSIVTQLANGSFEATVTKLSADNKKEPNKQ